MARTSLIPENVLRYKPGKCIRVRNDNGTYRVYRYTSVKLPSGKWSSSSGDLIGKIIPDVGFVPNKRYQKELDLEQKQKEADEKKAAFAMYSDEITDHAFGQYDLLMHLSNDVYERLKKFFPLEKATQIYAYALILCANGFVHVDQIDEIYQESFLFVLYRNFSFKMGTVALGNLLHDLGMKGEPVRAFEQSLIDESSKNIAIDGHVIRSCSNENDLAEPGYKLNLLKAPQINVLIAYDTKTKVPLMYHTYRGSSVDKKSCEHLLKSRSFEDVKFVVDRGFFAPILLDLMSSNGNSYIIPVPKSDKNFKRIKKNLQYGDGEFVYKSGPRDTARIIYQEESIDEKTRMILYKDVDENNSKRKSYKQSMDEGENGYTPEGYEIVCEWAGVYVLQTTTDEPAAEVFSDYKDRWSIETYNNYVKNDADFNDLKLQDYYNMQGFNFIMLVTGLIHSKLNDAVKSLKKSSISTYDILLKAGHMRMVKQDDHWALVNTRTKDLTLLKVMGYIPEVTYPPIAN